MSENTFDPQVSNANLAAAQYYIDDDGSLKFVSPYLSSSNFDGTIPVVEETITAENILPGMLLQVQTGEYLPVVSIAYDDTDLETSPNTTITVNYIDNNNELNSIDYNFTDSVNVRYEDWANKHLGNQGWTITSGGNAIFANVGVRGDLEATTLDVGGDTGITYDGTSVVIGASVVINAPVTFNGSGSFVTLDYLSSSYALQSFVDTVNTRLSSSISTLNINASTLSASMDFLYNAGFVTDTDLVTNGATVINGNNITTGTIDANQVNISSGLTGSRGIKINSLGMTAYNSSGTQTFNINSNTGVVTIGSVTADQLATDSELSSGLSGKINTGGAASDVNSNVTTISGGKIRTGSIESTTYSYTSGLYSNNGMQINLDTTGYIRSPNFYLDTSGNAYFKGDITAKSGYFGNSSYGMGIIDDGSTVTIRSTTLRIGSQLSGGTLYGSINFYTTTGVSLGNISATNSLKSWSTYGDGVGFGTSSDYLLLPGGSNTNRARYVGNGFNWYGADGTTLIMSIAGGTGGLRVQNNTGGIQVSGGGDISVSGGGRFVGDGSGLTNLPGGAGGGVTSFKFGDTGLTETGAVVITGAEIITAINDSSITNVKLLNRGLTIGTTTRNLGGTFTTGDIDGDVLTANTVAPGKIANTSNLFSIGGSGIVRGAAISTITGPLTIGTLTVSTSLDYVFNLGTTAINLNRSSGALGATLGGVNISGSAAALTNFVNLYNLGSTGALLYNNAGILGGLGQGVSGQFLKSNGPNANPTWANAVTNVMTAAGDMVYASDGLNGVARLAAGGTGAILRISGGVPSWLPRSSTAGQVLKINATGTDIEWGTDNTGSGLSNPMTGAGQMIYGSTATNPSTPGAVAAGTAGQVLVSGGTGAPSFTSTLSGITLNPTISIGITGTAGGGNVLVKAGSGNMLLGGTIITSSIKIKENINPLINYERIYDLNPITFYLKPEYRLDSALETNNLQIGFIAEEIAEIIPEAVQYEPYTNKVWNYSERVLLAVAIKTIQEQKKTIDLLEDRLSSLEARLDAAGL